MNHAFVMPPPVVGYWILPGGAPQCMIKFSCHTKPNIIHRYFMRILLGWKYENC